MTLGVDIGGTKINFVLLKNLRVVKTQKIFTPKNRKELIKVLKENIKGLTSGFKPSEIKGIGIGVPGPLNEKGDLILNPNNLKCLWNCPLAKIIERDLKIKTVIENDANCFTLGEATLGAGRGFDYVFGITLGTGVGGGIVIDGKLLRGAFGSAGESGHITIKFDGPKCTCGSYGCLEEYASERFFIKKGLLPKSLQKRAQKGNKKAFKIYNEYGKYLGIGLSNVINLLDPEIIIIGGGISNAYQFFIKAVKKEIRRRVISPLSKKNVKIKKAKLGNFAGAIGAALLI